MDICNKTSNNKYFGCPALMADGRITDYRPRGCVDQLIMKHNKITNSYQYHQFLVNNTDSLIGLDQQHWNQKMGCDMCNAKPVNWPTVPAPGCASGERQWTVQNGQPMESMDSGNMQYSPFMAAPVNKPMWTPYQGHQH